MNREIKFRVFDKQNNLMTYEGWSDRGFVNKSNIFDLGEDGVIMQYTGLKDKNIEEIYEGDIIRIGDENDGEINPNDSNTGIGPVVFICGLWYVDSPINNGLWDLKQSYTDILVIGNIYKNPEIINP